MLVARTTIATDEPERYLRQVCKHANAMASERGHRMRPHRSPVARGEIQLQVDYSETVGTVAFNPWGTCMLRVGEGALYIHVDAVDQAALQRIREIITRDLERFGRQELTIDWQEGADEVGCQSDGPTASPQEQATS